MIFGLPAPTGSFAVGTRSVQLPDGRFAQYWYPRLWPAGESRAPYRRGERGTAARRLLRSAMRTNSSAGGEPAAGPHALIVYVPSWGGQRGENTALMQELASHGYVVVAADDVEIGPPLDFSTSAALIRTRLHADVRVRRAAARTTELVTSGSQAHAGSAFGLFGAQVDPSAIGVLGYSFGGAVAGQLARTDTRVCAAVNLDGWMFGDAASEGVPQPFLIVGTGAPDRAGSEPLTGVTARDSTYTSIFDALNDRQIIRGLERHGGYYIALNGSRHAAFCDDALWPALHASARPGPLGGRRVHRIVGTYVTAFFNRYLRARTSCIFPASTLYTTAAVPRPLDPAIRIRFWAAPERYR